MSSPPSLRELVMDALQPTEQGFALKESKAKALLEVLAKSAQAHDPAAAKAVYEMAVVLERANGAPAARSLLKMMISTVEATTLQLKAMWSRRA